MGLFNYLGNKVFDILDAGIDALDKGFDVFSSTVDRALDKALDIETSIACGYTDLECNLRNIKSDIMYGQYKSLKEDTLVLYDSITSTRIELDKQVQSLLIEIESLIEQARYIQGRYQVAKETSLRLAASFREIIKG